MKRLRSMLFISVTNHAYERWCEFGKMPKNRNKLKARIRGILLGHLRVGLLIDHTGAAQLPIQEIWATVVPGEIGWVVVTFHRGEKFEEESEG